MEGMCYPVDGTAEENEPDDAAEPEASSHGLSTEGDEERDESEPGESGMIEVGK
jgi:hypothetical protein